MEAPVIDDELWALIEPLPSGQSHGARSILAGRVSDRAALNGILFVLKTGMRSNYLPTRLAFGSGATCWRRLRDWQKAGVCMASNARTAARQIARGRPDQPFIRRSRFLVNTSCWGGRKTGPNLTDRARPGSKRHILVDTHGVPISAILTGANRNDVTQLLPLVDAIVPIRGTRGRPLQKPKIIFADQRGIKPVIVKRRTEHSSGLGKFRWVVERTHSWLHNFFRRLRIRFDRRADIHEAFLKFGCALVYWNILRRTEQPF